MATEVLHARAELAKINADETAINEAASKFAADNAARKKELLENLREEDLEAVKKMCKQHGFTATQLRGYLVAKGRKKKLDSENPATKRRYTKKTATTL